MSKSKRDPYGTESVAAAIYNGVRRQRLNWFKPPALFAIRDVPTHFLGEHRPDFAKQPETNAEWADRELERPTSTLNQGTAHFAGKPYHWRQTYDSGLRLHAGASPW